MPVANSNSALPTSSATLRRSIAWAGERTGGNWNSRGMTDHSLASTTGTSARPSITCVPCVAAYSQLGCVGQLNR